MAGIGPLAGACARRLRHFNPGGDVETGFNKTEIGKVILAACFVNDLPTLIAQRWFQPAFKPMKDDRAAPAPVAEGR